MRRTDPETLLTIARDEFRRGNWQPYVEAQWGVVLTGEEYAPDVATKREWDSGRHGRFVILEAYQRAMFEGISHPGVVEVGIKGASGTGKGAVSAMATVAYYDCWDDANVVVTRDTFKGAKNVMWAEIKKWWKRCTIHPPGVLLEEKVGTEDHFIRVANPDTDEGFSGVHSLHVLFLFDEATAVPESRWKMARTQASKMVVIGNPRFNYGPFRQIFRVPRPDLPKQIVNGDRGLKMLITAAGVDASNVRMKRLDMPVGPPKGIAIGGRHYAAGAPIPMDVFETVKSIVPGQIDLARFLGLCADADKNFVSYMAHGKFPGEDSEFQLFPPSWVEPQSIYWLRWHALYQAAKDGGAGGENWWEKTKRRIPMMRLERTLPIQAFGLDLARSLKGDKTVLASGGRRGVRALHSIALKDTVSIVEWVLDTIRNAYAIELTHGNHAIGVDMQGVGAGVGDVLRSRGCRVVECRGNDTAKDSKRWGNKRAENFGTLSERLSMNGAFFGYSLLPPDQRKPVEKMGVPFALPDDPELWEELATIEKVFSGKDRLKVYVTPKEGDDIVDKTTDPPRVTQSIIKRIGRSPDKADAVQYLWQAVREAPTMDLDRWVQSMDD